VSVDSHQPVSSVGVFLDAGSVWEQPNQAGSTLFLQSMAFKSTQSMSEVAVYNAAVQYVMRALTLTFMLTMLS
jgi:predicted Zn-dependent peptidase